MQMVPANLHFKNTYREIEPSKGDIIITPGQRLSFLKQDHFQYDEFVALDTVIMGNERLYDIMKEKMRFMQRRFHRRRWYPCQ